MTSNILEFCSTRAKKSTLDTLKFYIVSNFCDKVTHTEKCTTYWSKLKAPSIQTKVQKMKDLLKIWVAQNNCLKISDQKNQSFHTWHAEQKRNDMTINTTPEQGSCNQEEIN